MSEQNEAVDVAEETFIGDLVSMAVTEIKNMPKSWQELSEDEQGEVIERLQNRAKSAAGQAINIIASNNRPTVLANIESITFKAGIKAVLQVSPQAAHRHELADAEGCQVMLVIPHTEQMTENGEGMPEADKDQPELGLDEDSLFDEAMQTVKELNRVSISALQRKMKIGYNRAANLIEQLQRAGIVTEPDERGARSLVLRKDIPESEPENLVATVDQALDDSQKNAA